jgi:hypothetical protein
METWSKKPATSLGVHPTSILSLLNPTQKVRLIYNLNFEFYHYRGLFISISAIPGSSCRYVAIPFRPVAITYRRWRHLIPVIVSVPDLLSVLLFTKTASQKVWDSSKWEHSGTGNGTRERLVIGLI